MIQKQKDSSEDLGMTGKGALSFYPFIFCRYIKNFLEEIALLNGH